MNSRKNTSSLWKQPVEVSGNGAPRLGAPRDTDSTKLTVSQVYKKKKGARRNDKEKVKKKGKALHFSLKLQGRKTDKLRT